MRKALFFFQKSSDPANMAVSDRITYEFADFRLIPKDNLLLRNGESVPLPPKAFSTLVQLVQSHGHLVRKDELIEKIWSESFVEESAVSRCVWMIRNALGEDSKSDRFIKTVPKLGYKFVGDVQELNEPELVQAKVNGNGNGNGHVEVANSLSLVGDLGEAPEPVAEDVPAPQTRLGLYVALAAIALAVVGIAAVYLASVGTTTAGTGSRIAVLPLKPVDAANRSNIYEIGVADSLINRLNSIKGFVVRPLSATRKYDAVDQDPLAAGREQQVDHVIDSNYQIVDGRFRFTAQLINVSSGRVEDSYKVETDARNVFAIQEAVTNEIAKKLTARFERAAVGSAAKRGTNNEEAYRLYLQGKNLTMMRTPDAAKKAFEYLEQAVKLDPNFAHAYAQMASTYRKFGSDDEDESTTVKRFIDKALALDPDLADAYVARAGQSLIRDWNFPAVEKDLARAIQLEPNNDSAHWYSALLLTGRGRLDEALVEIDIAQSIDPGAVLYMFHRGRVLYYARRYDEAITQYQQAMDLDDRFMQPYGWMSRVYEIRGDYATAFQYFLKREVRTPRKDRVASYQKTYETDGWMGVRRELADDDVQLFDVARLHALKGEKDAAFENLNKAVEKREWLIITLNVEPAFDNLRGDPRFAVLQKRVAFERS